MKSFLEHNPGVVNAANHVVQNGIKQGGYDVVRSAIENALDHGGEEGALQAGLNGLNGTFQGSGSFGSDLMNLGENAVKKNNTGRAPFESRTTIEAGYVEEESADEPEYPVEKSQQNPNTQQEPSSDNGLLAVGGYALKKAQQFSDALERANNTIEATATQVDRLSGNITKVRGSGERLLASMRRKPPAPARNVAEIADDALQYADDVAEVANTGLTETAVQGAASTFQKSLSSAAKGGLVGAAIGVTMEAVVSYKKFKNGELTKEEYAKEIAKSGGQFGISGAATAGITTAITPALSAVAGTLGVACPVVSIPVSIVLGIGIDKIIAPAFGRGAYKKILDDAKYYQNLIYAHDDLVQAIAMSEQQFGMFIEEYARQMQVHTELTDQNRQINQLHGVANARLQLQTDETKASLAALGDLFNKI